MATLQAQPTHFRLNDLPAELRNEIYELVVYHEEGGGVISPVTKRPPPSTLTRREQYVMARDRLTIILRAGERIHCSSKKLVAAGLNVGGARTHDDEDFEGVWESLPEHQKHHLCTLHCLCQPALTRVSQQIRQESLPIFYGQNKFHAELSNFRKNGEMLIKSPFVWWKAIGDANLSLICRMNIFDTSMFEAARTANGGVRGVMIKYRRVKEGGCSVTRTSESIDVEHQNDHTRMRQGQHQFEEKMRDLELALNVVAVGGLQMEALTRMTELIRPDRSM